MNFATPESIVLYLDDLIERVRKSGVSNEANELYDILHASWTTSSEWLGEIKLALLNILRNRADKLTGSVRDEITEFVGFVDEAWNNANRLE